MIESVRAWARSYSDRGHYSPVGVGFHWIMSVLVLFQLGWGVYMGTMAVGADKLDGYSLHGSVGLLILILAALRLLWRIVIPGPVNDADEPGWQATAAHLTHYAFYLCFFAMPISGWAMWSAMGNAEPLAIAGVIPWPNLPFETLPPTLQWAIIEWAGAIHSGLAAALAVLTALHVAAALKHHFWDRHDVLVGMLPEISDAEDSRKAATHTPKPAPPRPASSAG